MQNLFPQIFGKRDKTPQNSSKPGTQHRARHLHYEPLEERQMLSVSPLEFNMLRAAYPDLNLRDNMVNYNVIEISAAELSSANLQAAIDTAAQTTQDDLIVVRTDGKNNTVLLDGNPMTIDIDAAQFGSVAIVSLSSTNTPLTVDTQEISRAFRINSGIVGMGGMNILGQTWDFDIGSDYDGLIAVRGQSELTTSHVQTVASVYLVSTSFDPMNMPGTLVNDALTWDRPVSGVWDAGNSIPTGTPGLGGTPYGAGAADTSEYMIGDVWVTLVLFESNGAIDPDETLWSSSQINQVKTQVRQGLDWWEAMFDKYNPNSQIKLGFTVDFTWANNPFETSYEAIRQDDDETWGGEFLASQGYSGDYDDIVPFLLDMNNFNNTRRNANNTDWAYSIFVVNTRDASNQYLFDGNERGYAYLGGPYVAMSYDNDGWGIDRMGTITAHETGHIFYALDEYPGASSYFDRSGYYNIQNTNAIDDHPNPATRTTATIMGDGYEMPRGFDSRTSSVPSLQSIGWRDTDGNGILDVLDTPMTLATIAGNYDILTKTFFFSATSSVTTLPNRNPNTWPNSPGRDITLNTVDKLQYKLNDGTWITLDATYGGMLNVNVGAIVSIAGLIEGDHSITFRTLCERTGTTSTEREFDFIVPIKLDSPLLVSVVATGSSTINVTWATVENADGYIIQYSTNSAFTSIVGMETIRSQTLTSMIIAGLEPYTTYYVRILAVGSEYYCNSDYSDWKSATTEKAVLPRPTLDNNISTFGDTIYLEWNTVPNAGGYVVQYATNAAFTQGAVTVPLNFGLTSRVNLIDLEPNTNYYVRIKADGTNTAAYLDSEYSAAKTMRTGRFELAAPAVTEVIALTHDSIAVSWKAVSNVSGYVVQYATNTAFTENVVTVSMDSPSTTSAEFTGIIENTTYYVRVRAIRINDDYIDSDYVPARSVATPAYGTVTMPRDGEEHEWGICLSADDDSIVEIVDFNDDNHVLFTYSLDLCNSIVVNSGGLADDSLTIDLSYGDFLLANGIRFNGHEETNNTLHIIGTEDDDSVRLVGTEFHYNDLIINTQNVESFLLDAGTGSSQAYLIGTEPGNMFNVSDNSVVMIGGGYRIELVNFNAVDAVAAGNKDQTYIFAENNSLIVMSEWYVERNSRNQSYRVWYSGQVTAKNMDDTNNTVLHNGSLGQDTYTVSQGLCAVTNAFGSYSHELQDFKNITISTLLTSPTISLPTADGWTQQDDQGVWTQNGFTVTVLSNANVITRDGSALPQRAAAAPVEMPAVAPVATVFVEVTQPEAAMKSEVEPPVEPDARWDETLFAFLADEQMRQNRKNDNWFDDDADNWLADFEKLALMELRK